MTAPLVIANWKMHKTPSETEAWLAEALPALIELKAGAEVEVCIAPPFTSLAIASRMLAGSGVALAAQDCHWTDQGPYTGEVSARMLAEVGCRYVLLGHSERRDHFAETDRVVGMKAAMALAWDLHPVICVGEKEDERASHRTDLVVERQLKRCLADLKPGKGQRIVVAYEPVWAIGSGRTPAVREVEDVHRLIRSELEARFGRQGHDVFPILYGGSVTPDCIGPLMGSDSIDGVLVGGASLEPARFLPIVQAARAAGPQAIRSPSA